MVHAPSTGPEVTIRQRPCRYRPATVLETAPEHGGAASDVGGAQVRRDHWVLPSLATGPMNVIAYGHAGRPVVFIGAERTSAWAFEETGLLDAVAWLLEQGRLRLYAVDTYDNASWRNDSIAREDRARAHQRFEDFVLADLVPAVHSDCGWLAPIAVTRPSLRAFQAVDLRLGVAGADRLPRAGPRRLRAGRPGPAPARRLPRGPRYVGDLRPRPRRL